MGCPFFIACQSCEGHGAHSLSQEMMQMRCAWEQLLMILPLWLRREVDGLGRESMQELRLRTNCPPELVQKGGSLWLRRNVTEEDLSFCLNAASRYSPWNAATLDQGYLTAPGGHRIGVCGGAVVKGEKMAGIRDVTSLCIRVARDFDGIEENLGALSGSILILGPPGWGKTTLLRALIRRISEGGEHVAVVDERQELFPSGGAFERGKCTDVLSGCPKAEGILTVLRTMGPDTIAVDEITAQEDTQALLRAANCGVRLLATAHAASRDDLKQRAVYRPLLESSTFANLVIMNRDKSWKLERMNI